MLSSKIEVKDEPLSEGESPSSKPGSSKSSSKHKSSSSGQSEKQAKLSKQDSQAAEEKLIDGKTKEEWEKEERERMQ